MSAQIKYSFPDFLDGYKHIALIGSGYFSHVKWYQHQVSGEDVAVKSLKPEFKSNSDYLHRFEREVRILEQLRGQKNIVELIGAHLSEDEHVYIMEKASSNLYDYIKRHNSTLSIKDRIFLFDQVLAAISHAHSQNILHRDINPQNVLMFKEGEEVIVKVSDFGIGKDLAATSAFTHTHVAQYGQMYYTAPEQRLKLKDATVRSDIYSLGKLLNFICLGKDPDIIRQCDFSSLIVKAAHEEPDKRFSNIQEFTEAYRRIRSLLLPDVGLEEITLILDFIENVKSTGIVDWHLFHRLAKQGHHDGYIFGNYINPVIEFFASDGAALYGYYDTVGASIEEFVSTFSARIEELPTTGWPFSATSQFGDLFGSVFYIASEPHIKLQCLKEIWKLAYEQDQWGCQTIVDRILDGNVPEEIQTDFAVFIQESKANVSLKQFANLNLPIVIRRAIASKSQGT